MSQNSPIQLNVSRDRILDMLKIWKDLTDEGMPLEREKRLADLINFNEKGPKETLGSVESNVDVLSEVKVIEFMREKKKWGKQDEDHKARVELLRKMLQLRSRPHYEMVDMTVFQKIVDIKKLSILFSRAHFVNFTVQENGLNNLLELQGYFIKSFIYFHMRHDMRFKATIDSYMIQMDNPYSRSQIRLENRNDPYLSGKYIQQLRIEEFCINLLDRFFPNVSGIWADSVHLAPAYILQFIRLSLEFGLITDNGIKKMIPLLVRASNIMMKLEEGWVEKNHESKFSVKMKAFNIVKTFAKCREHMSMILISLLVQLNDSQFMEMFPRMVEKNTTEKEIKEEVLKQFIFFNKDINNSLLQITMNYLSGSVDIMGYKSMTDFSKKGVEKIFLMLTTTDRDPVLSSLKQITLNDLKYIGSSKSSNNDLAEDLSKEADFFGHSLKNLLEMVSKGLFDNSTGMMREQHDRGANFEKYLLKFVGTDRQMPITVILKRILAEITKNLEIHEDLKVYLVKESVPLKLVALCNYTFGYFSEEIYSSISKDAFASIEKMTINNNFGKAQLFKGECLFHLNKLLRRFDVEAFRLLFKLTEENNAAVFMGREVFVNFLMLYEEFNNKICESLDLTNGENLTNNLQIESCMTQLLMIKYLDKLFTRTFPSELEKIQNILLTQENIHKNLKMKYLPILIQYLKNSWTSNMQKSQGTLTNELFVDGNEVQLMTELESGVADETSKHVVLVHICFFTLKLFNNLCRDCTSHKFIQEIKAQVESVKEHINNSPLTTNRWFFPIGLELELIRFIDNFGILTPQQTLIENETDMNYTVLEACYKEHLGEYSHELTELNRELNAKGHQLTPVDDELKKMREMELEDTPDYDKLRAIALNIRNEMKTLSDRLLSLPNKKKNLAYIEISIIKSIFDRISLYSANCQDPLVKKEGQEYVMAGALPIYAKYLETVRKLSVVNNSKAVSIAHNRVMLMLQILIEASPHITKLMMLPITKKPLKQGSSKVSKLEEAKEIIDEEKEALNRTDQGASPDWQLTKKNSRENLDSYMSVLPDFEAANFKKQNIYSICFDGKLSATVDAIQKPLNKQDVYQKEAEIWKGCAITLEAIKEFYYGTSWYHLLASREDISKEDILSMLYATKFDETTSDPELKEKSRVLNAIIREYQEAKDDYLKREEEPNLLSFFHKNHQNMKGVFNSCLDRLMNRTKQERKKDRNYLADDYPVSKFWVQTGNIEYIQMIGMLLQSSYKARDELYDFIGGKKKEILEEDQDELEDREPSRAVATQDLGEEVLLCTLLRVQTDLVMFLSSNCNQNMVWWVIHQTYEMISMFFKNLCECNHMNFKNYLGETIPVINGHTWKYFSGLSYTAVFSEEFKFMMKTTKLAENREPRMVHSDYYSRTHEVLLPLLKVINETVIGPCETNQNIIIESDLSSLCNIATRIIDDLGSNYYEVSSLALQLVTALTEGFKEVNLLRISYKLPPNILMDRIQRLIKKLYVRQLIREGDFEMKEQAKPKDNVQKNQIAPAPSRTISKEETKAIAKRIALRIQDEITSNMEKQTEITHWSELYQMYMDEEEFCNSPIFDFAFRLLVLWKVLAVKSKTHMTRMLEAKEDANKINQFSFLSGLSNLSNLAIPDLKILKNDPKVPEKSSNSTSEFTSIFYFLSKKILCDIEVIDQQENKIILSFPLLPACFMLSDEAKKNYLNDCDISDSNTKMVDLLRNFNLFRIQMERSFRVSKFFGRLYTLISTDAFYYYTIFCWILGFAISVLLLISYVRVDTQEFYAFSSSVYDTVITVLGIILAALSGLLLVLWFATKYPQVYEVSTEDFKFDHPGKNPKSFRAVTYISVVKSFLNQNFPVSYSLHLLFTLMGLFSYDLFYSLNLLLIINISNTTKFVLKSILLHIDQLALTLLMAVFVIYFYTLVAMSYLYNQIDLNDGNTICIDVYSCFFYVFNMGLRNGGGFAESLKGIDTANKFVLRVIFDVTFFMFINVIALNVIFGIIIDTFSQLRDDQNARATDAENNCFVCGNTRADFSKRSVNFNEHIVKDHDPWNYIYYIFYLEKKGEDELSGIEYYSWTGYKQKEVNWIPIGNTLYLEADDTEQLKNLDEKITQLEESLKTIAKKSSKSLDRFQKLVNHMSPLRSQNNDINIGKAITKSK